MGSLGKIISTNHQIPLVANYIDNNTDYTTYYNYYQGINRFVQARYASGIDEPMFQSK